ncbi:MAG: hypothetical protein HKN26_11520 [Acidimicrobiales bacterium]|nr:hypothetical protein [Acidimicrobiales bacterium]
MSKPAGLSLFVVAALITSLTTFLPSATAQDPSPGGEPVIDLEPVPSDQVQGIPLADGDYQGTIGLGGSFWLPSAQVNMRWQGRGSGPVTFTVANGQITGTWSMNGSADIVMTAGPVSGTGTNTWSDTGQITGSSSGPMVMVGNGGSSTSTVTVQVPGIGAQTQSSTDAIPAATVELERMLDVCGQVTASWDNRIQAAFQGSGLSHSIRTYLIALPVGRAEIQEAIDDLTEDAARLTENLGDPELTILNMAVLVNDAEQLLEQIEASEDPNCNINDAFMRIVTQHIQDVMNTLLNNWDGYDSYSEDLKLLLLRRMLQTALRSGAIGPGAADQSAADHLEGQAAAIAQDAFDRMVAEEAFDERIGELGMIGQLLGIDYVGPEGNPVDSSDLCIIGDGEAC